MKRTILIGATCAVLGGAGVAGAQTTHILGRDGPTVPLDAMCHREVVPAPGETLEMTVNVIGQQVHCLIRRPDPFAQCVEKLGPAPAVVAKVDHPNGFADWKGVDKLQRYVARIGSCSTAHLE
jgi:hypothetical protein